MVIFLQAWQEYALMIIIVVLIAALLYLVSLKKGEKTDENQRWNFEPERGIAIKLVDVDADIYIKIGEIIHPKGYKKFIAILPDPDDGFEPIFVEVNMETEVPAKFEVRGGEIIPLEEDEKA